MIKKTLFQSLAAIMKDLTRYWNTNKG